MIFPGVALNILCKYAINSRLYRAQGFYHYSITKFIGGEWAMIRLLVGAN
jgi:hypothetical protein